MLISPRGASPIVIFPSRQNVNGEYYREWMLRRVVRPFIDIHYPDRNYWFWFDLAPGHTAQATVDVLRELDIDFVEENLNPPNCPQLRPIERFWAHLKRKVYESGWEARDLKQLKERIEKVVRDIEPSYFTRLMKNVNHKIRKAAKCGVNSVA